MILFSVAYEYNEGEEAIFSTFDLAMEYAKAHNADFVYRIKVDDPGWEDPEDIGWTSDRILAERASR